MYGSNDFEIVPYYFLQGHTINFHVLKSLAFLSCGAKWATAREPTSSGDDEFVCVRLSKAAKNFDGIIQQYFFLALAISKVVSLRSGGKSWGQQDGVPGGVFFVMTLLVILSALNQLGSLLSCYSNKPNKLWILSGACGHVVGFILVEQNYRVCRVTANSGTRRFCRTGYTVWLLFHWVFFFCITIKWLSKERKPK